MDRRRRIGRAPEVRRVRHAGRCWSGDVLVLCALPTGRPLTRFAFVVSKRQGGAVVRNRVKRRLREATRRLAAGVPAGYDIVMIARGPLVSRTSAELGQSITDLLRRARLRPVAPASPPPIPSPPMASAPPGRSIEP